MERIARAIDRLETGTAWCSATHLRALAVLVLVSLALFLPGFAALPVTDRDEARFAQASRQMVESGDLVQIMLQDVPRLKKPVGIYWLQSAVVAALGADPDAPIWHYRLPSLLAGVAATVLTYAIAVPLIGTQAAFWAAILMAAGLVMGGEARLAKTDATLLAVTLGALALLVRLYPQGQKREFPLWMAVLFWVCLAAGILIKGPIAPMVVGTTILGLCAVQRGFGWLRPIRPGWGLLILAVLVLPWFVAITVKTGGAFWTESLVKDLVAKTAAGQESHGAPAGSYLAALWVTFWPGSMVLALGLPMLWRLRRHPAMLWALVWVVPTWVVFEVTPTKLIHYVLPTYPALAMLAALAWAERPAGPLPKWARILGLGFLLVPVGVLLAVLWVAMQSQSAAGLAALAALPVLAGLGALLWHALARDARGASVAVLAAMALVTFAAAYASLSRIDALWPSTQAARIIQAQANCPQPRLVSASYLEPSLVFLTSKALERVTGAEAAAAFVPESCVIAVVDEANLPDFLTQLEALKLTPILIGQATGVALGAGKPVSLALYINRADF